MRQAGRCHELLEKLLLLMQDGQQVSHTRPPLYAALLSYLRLCRNPGQSQIPPSLLKSALDGDILLDHAFGWLAMAAMSQLSGRLHFQPMSLSVPCTGC